MANGKGCGIGVTVRGGNVNKALQIFKKKIKNSKVLVEYKERMQYTKPSETKRKERRLRKKRSQKYARSQKY